MPTFPQTNFLSRIPNNATVIGEIKRFVAPPGADIKKAQIELTNGTVRLFFLFILILITSSSYTIACRMHLIFVISYILLD